MEAEVNVENKGVGGGVMLCLCLSFTAATPRQITHLLKTTLHCSKQMHI